MRRRSGRVAGLVVVMIVLAACATHAPVSPEALLDRAGKDEGKLLERVGVYEDPRVGEYLTGIVARLACRACVTADVGIRVTVIMDPTLAAFMMPGGRLFVHSGLLAATEDEEQVAAVLARELAHDPATLRPRPRKAGMSTVTLSPTGAALLGLDLQVAIAAAVEGYGGGDERKADVEALRRLVQAGYDPRAAWPVFERFAAGVADRDGLAEIFFYGNRERLGEREAAVSGRVGAQVSVGGGDEFARRVRPLVRENARLDLRAGRFALARRQLERVLAADPRDAVAHVYAGELSRLEAQRASGPARTEKAAQALASYRRALELDPGSAEPLRQLALLHYQAGDAVAARTAFERFLAVKPDGPEAQRIRGYLAILGRE